MARILIVDDSALARTFIRRCVEIVASCELEFIEAESGSVAMNVMAKEEPFDLVITDLIMPEMDGLEVLRAMRANEKLADVPVLVITSTGCSHERDEIISLGVTILSKPISPPAVASAIAQLLPVEA